MERDRPRIVSLLGSATEIVYALGLQDALVGISHECDHPPEALRHPRLSRPRFDPAGLDSGEIDAAVRRCMDQFGSVYAIDADALERAAPGLVLTQAVCEVCAVPTGSVEAAVRDLPVTVRVESLDAHTLDGILATVRQVADAAGAPQAGAELADRLRLRIQAVRDAVAARPRPRTLLLEWLDPPFSPGHWVPEMIDAAGGECLLGRAGARSEAVTREAIRELDPEVLLIEPCGFDLPAAREDAERNIDWLRAIAPRAFASGDVWLLHSAWFSRSGPRVVEGIETLAAVLHPDRFGAVDPARAERLARAPA